VICLCILNNLGPRKEYLVSIQSECVILDRRRCQLYVLDRDTIENYIFSLLEHGRNLKLSIDVVVALEQRVYKSKICAPHEGFYLAQISNQITKIKHVGAGLTVAREHFLVGDEFSELWLQMTYIYVLSLTMKIDLQIVFLQNVIHGFKLTRTQTQTPGRIA
jgi:hypothetical protein